MGDVRAGRRGGLCSLRSGLAETVLLDVSNAELIWRMARTEPGLRRRWCRAPCGARLPTILNAGHARRNASGWQAAN
jgi:hypothetical protein